MLVYGGVALATYQAQGAYGFKACLAGLALEKSQSVAACASVQMVLGFAVLLGSSGPDLCADRSLRGRPLPGTLGLSETLRSEV